MMNNLNTNNNSSQDYFVFDPQKINVTLPDSTIRIDSFEKQSSPQICLDTCNKSSKCSVVNSYTKLSDSQQSTITDCNLYEIQDNSSIKCSKSTTGLNLETIEKTTDTDSLGERDTLGERWWIKKNVKGAASDTCNSTVGVFTKNSYTPNVNDFDMFQYKEYVNDLYYLPTKKILNHTKFSMQDIDVRMPVCNWGETVTCDIPYHGDLLNSIFVEIKLPKMNIPGLFYRRMCGHYIIQHAYLLIDNQRIAHHYSFTNFIDNGYEIKQPNFEKMITPPLYDPLKDTGDDNTLYTKLNFWFCKDYFNSLPLLCLKNRKIQLSIQIANLSFLLLTTDDIEYSPFEKSKTSFQINEIQKFSQQKSPEISLLCKYIFLEKIERSKFIQNKLIYNMNYSIEKFYFNTNNINLPLPVSSHVKELQLVFLNEFYYSYNPLETININNISDLNQIQLYYIQSNKITKQMNYINNQTVPSLDFAVSLPTNTLILSEGFYQYDKNSIETVIDSNGQTVVDKITLINLNNSNTFVTLNNFTNTLDPNNSLFFTVDQIDPKYRFIHMIRSSTGQYTYTNDIDIVNNQQIIRAKNSYFTVIPHTDNDIQALDALNFYQNNRFFYVYDIEGSKPGSKVVLIPGPDYSSQGVTNPFSSPQFINILNTKAPEPDISISVESPYASFGPYSLKQLYLNDLNDPRSIRSRDYHRQKYRKVYARTSNNKNCNLLFSDDVPIESPTIFQNAGSPNPNDISNYIYKSRLTPIAATSKNSIRKQRSRVSIMNNELLQLTVFRIPFSLDPLSNESSGHINIDDKWQLRINDKQNQFNTYNIMLNIIIEDFLIIQNNSLYFQKYTIS